MGIETKICSKCKKTISIDDFHHTRKGNIKRRAWCKTCDRDYHIQYYLTHQEEHKKASVEYRNQKKSENPLLVWCQASIKSHKIRSKYLVYFTPMELHDKFVGQTHCEICGKLLEWFNKIPSHDSPTLDRINNDNHMNLENVQLICNKCNVTKSDRTMNEFIDYCKMVVDKYAA